MKPREGATVLDRLHQSGPLRLRIIRPEPGTETTAILLNTAGGIAGGDRHDIAITGSAATTLTLTTQGAERVYRATPSDPPSRITTRIALADRAALDYLPQETILFDRSALTRHLRIDLTGTARFLGLEALIFGRTAMGETIHSLHLTDTIELHRDMRLIFRDSLHPPPDFATSRHRALFGTATALATILLAAPDAARHLDAVRAALGTEQAGASAWNGLLLIRILAQTGATLREIVLRVMNVLRGGRKMPRVWAC
ncbi:urease accessory protein UreD [Acidiphilium acidophilum]|uniref:Urease accessory protein UreD n=1 Tax=Acidiphilium acidophilum TaxID=76588 RepID=A0AAW9DLR7_ACIAO|nr:urease accessory protein UreD [Acidiphilium acidophilum]MDX5929966.1 urease accessory protein UreD [Acidiphilium acidophilum]GBR74874.1 urease accessory protein [Acidiphilium acidophilum DSM 700]